MPKFMNELRIKILELLGSGRASSVYETVLWEIYRTWIVKPGAVVIDIGAHKGLHTFRLADIVGKHGKVYSFEPTQSLATELQSEVEKKGLAEIIDVVNSAVGDTVGTIDFYYSESHPTQSTIVYGMGKNFATTSCVSVSALTLDHFFSRGFPGRLSFIKIDAEGAETKILHGAKELLSHSNVLLAIEFSFSQLETMKATPEDFFLFLEQIDYLVFDLAGREITLPDILSGNTPWTHELILSKKGHWTNDFCSDPNKMASITDRVIARELAKL